MIYLYLFGTCFHFIYVFMIIDNIFEKRRTCFPQNTYVFFQKHVRVFIRERLGFVICLILDSCVLLIMFRLVVVNFHQSLIHVKYILYYMLIWLKYMLKLLLY